ncbi:MAG: phosphodiester glycosidase family protein [Clostridia bacterium]|nr:phosphodiester glycosidase family protein [Clostridia bacterium]
MGSLLKKYSSIFICFLLMMLIFASSCYAGTYINTYYKDDVSEEISKGVTHISGTRLTSKGLVKAEIIKVDLSNDKLKFENVFNKDSMGKKTTVNNLVKNKSNVVAAVNGDFFEMGLTPSFELGITMNDGKIEKLSSGEYYNCYSNSLAALLLDDDNNPYIDFVKGDIIFENDKDSVYVSYYNKAGDKEGTVILDGDYFTTSYSMDMRNPNTYKLIVEKNKRGDEITSIIEPGTTVDIKSNEYVVFIPANFNRVENFEVGDDVSLSINLNIGSQIETAVGGAGVFLQNGQIVQNGYIISSSTARSFIGFDSSKKYLYFGTVGGLTSTNAGLTSNQLAEIVKEYGVSNAMHLDGGGSSTLVAKTSYNNQVKQVNDVRSQRAIINAFVVTNDSTSKKLAGVKLNLNNKAILNSTVPFEVCGYDENHNEVTSISTSSLKITSDKETEIDYRKQTIKFLEKGRTNLKISCNGYSQEMYVDIYETLSEIQILPDPIIVNVKEEVDLNIVAFTGENYKIPIDPDSCDYIISPSSLAKIVDGKLVGVNSGVGTVTVNYEGLSASSILSVGTEIIDVENFNNMNMTNVSYPENVECEIENVNGMLKINYDFEKSDVTQAAYAEYNTALKLPSGSQKLILDLKGDNKRCMLKVRLIDDANNEYAITMCNDINSTSTKTYTAELPTGYTGNLYIDRYYVAILSTKKSISSSITIDNVKCEKNLNYSGVKAPSSITKTITSYDSSIDGFDDEDFIFFNNSSKGSLLANYIDNKVGSLFDYVKNEKLFVARNTDKVNGVIENAGLNKYIYEDTLVIAMSTIAGSAFDKDPYQYGQLENILNGSNVNNVIITLDGDLNSSALAKDKAMLDYILNKYYQTKRVNFYVIMYAGTTSSDIINNGIRYLRVPSTLSDAFAKSVLVIRRDKDDNSKLNYNFVTYQTVFKNINKITTELAHVEEEKDIDEEINLENEITNEGGNDEE